jgi:pyruvate/2-oxoglutarate dehydrogenase complex dihydrolipoamide acyltransferase (E2) component
MDLVLPRVGMSMEEATISEWHKQPGDVFAVGEGLYDIETDKVLFTVEATTAGRLLSIEVPAGEVAAVGQVVARAEP